MRKNYFAKKFVAYSMAFAVAFSTLTVSPVFVKEASATTPSALTISDLSDIVINGNDVILEAMTTEESSAQTMTKAEFKTATGIDADKVINATVSKTTNATDNYAKNYTMTAGVTDSGSNTAGLSTSDTIVNTNADTKHTLPIIINGKVRGTNPGEHANGNKQVKLEMTDTASNGVTWFKLVPFTTTFDRTYVVSPTTKTEKITVNGYNVKKVTDTTTNVLTFEEVTSDNMGLYLGVSLDASKSTATATNYELFNLYEKSDLTLTPNQRTIVAKVGDSATIEVVPTSTRPVVSYRWSKAGTDLSYTTPTINLSDIKDSDYGTYMCVANDGITDSSPCLIDLEKATAPSDDQKAAATEFTTYKKCLKLVSGSSYMIEGGKVRLTATTPSDDSYRYVWVSNTNFDNISGVDVLPMSESDEMAYDAKNNSITITTDSQTIADNSELYCYVLSKEVYEDAFEDELKAIDEASSNTKYAKVQALRATEQGKSYGSGPSDVKYLYKETIKLTSAATTVSETVQLKIGETLSLTAPTVADAATYTWKFDNNHDSVDDAEETVTNTVNTLKKNTVGINDFGAYTLTIKDASSGILLTKVFNVVYKSDLEATASDVSAKLGAKKVTLNVKATASLPISYTWNFVPVKTKTDGGDIVADYTDGDNDANITLPNSNYGTLKNNSETVEISEIKNETKKTSPTKPVDHFFVAKDKDHAVDANYYTCKVDDGIIEKTLVIKVSEISTFDVYENEEDAEKEINKITGTPAPYNFANVKDSKTTLGPVVKVASKDIEAEMTYKWTKNGTAFADTKTVDVTYPEVGTDSYVLTITEGTKTVQLTYNLKAITEKDLKDLATTLQKEDFTVDDENEMVYTGNPIDPINSVIADLGTSDYTLVKGVDYEVILTNAVNTSFLGAKYEIKFIGNFADVEFTTPITDTFSIVRAENILKVEDKTVVLGGSVQPKTTNLSKGAVTYSYYADADCTTELEAAPTKVGTYYVKATSIATTNYNHATSNVATVKVVPGKVKMLGTSRTASSVKLNWTKATGATSYRVYYKAPGAKSYKWFKNTTATSIDVTGLASATTYTFAVKAYAKTAGYSTVYATKQTTTAPAKVATPSVTAGSKKATVKFTKVARATGYQIYMAKGNGKYVKVKTTTSTSFTKTGLAKGATYKFKVRAYKTVGSNTYYGAFSSAKAVKVK